MDLVRSYEFFQPEKLRERVHIIGCGAVGSTLAEMLARFGITQITLWDFDKVEPHNIANQMFFADQIGRPKVEAVAETLKRINPAIENDLKLEAEGWSENSRLDGYVFLAVDNIDLRRKICESIKFNRRVKGVFDFRMGLTDGQHYAADWSTLKNAKRLIDTMCFTQDQVVEVRSACNSVLSVCPSIRSTVAAGVANFINFVKDGVLKNMILLDAFGFSAEAV